MALTLESINLVKQRTRWDSRTPGVSEALRSLWKHMEALGNIDLQFVPYDETGQVGKVIADVPCKLYAFYLKKPADSTVLAFLKLINASTVGTEAHGDITVILAAAVASKKEFCLVFHDGLTFSAGITVASDTANDGSTASEIADSCAGFCIVGGA